MPLILNIETSSSCCSVAVGKDGKAAIFFEDRTANNHASSLHTMIDKALTSSGYRFQDIDAVSVSKGPGSYTGLRIGVSAAKGICYAMNIPLIGIDTLSIIASALRTKRNSLEKAQTPCLFAPMIDARRMEVYSAVFSEGLERLIEPQALILNDLTYSDLRSKNRFIVGGEGSEKWKPLIETSENITFIEGVYPTALNMVSMAENYLKEGKTENLAYFEPFYLKEFIAAAPRVKGLQA